jgi:hypothetical protein
MVNIRLWYILFNDQQVWKSGFCFIHYANKDYFPKHRKPAILMVKCGVLFEVRTKFLNIVYTTFGFKGLILAVLTSLGAHFRLTLSIQPGRFP